MAKIVGTVKGDFLELVFNTKAKDFKRVEMRISEIRSVCEVVSNPGPGGVAIIFASNNTEIFQADWFDSLNGVTDLDTDAKLCDAFLGIVNPQP